VALLAFAAVLAGVGVVTASMPKAYQSTAYLLVTPDQPGTTDFEQTQISQALVTTYARLLESQNMADEVGDRLGGAFDGNPRDAITVEAVPDSQLLTITGEASPTMSPTIEGRTTR
jgi:capsular polysaccharide biosynthesis protein